MHKTGYLLSIVLQFLKLQTNESYARGKLTMKETAVSNNFMTLFAHWDKQLPSCNLPYFLKKRLRLMVVVDFFLFIFVNL